MCVGHYLDIWIWAGHYLNMSETDGLSPVLKTQLLDGKVLLEHLCGAIQCHFDVGEDGKPLPVHQ